MLGYGNDKIWQQWSICMFRLHGTLQLKVS